jgi:hypothetical protein
MKLKRIKFHLQLWDGIWSVPLGMLLFLGCGVFLQTIFYNRDDPQGGPGFYDPSFLQSAFYASCMQVFINFVVWLGIHFNFRRIKHYHTGQPTWTSTGQRPGQPLTAGDRKSHAAGEIPSDQVHIDNHSKRDFELLSPWQRLVLLFALYAFYSAEWLVIWGHLL